MQSKLLFYTLVLTLVAATGWIAMHSDLVNRNPAEANRVASSTELESGTTDVVDIETSPTDNAGKITSFAETNISFASIERLIRLGFSQQAANNINQHYSHLSGTQLKRLKQDFLNTAARASIDKKKSILLDASGAFDQLDVWQALARASEVSADWQLAFDAQLRASELENDSLELQALLTRMAKSSRYLRAGYEKNGDQLSTLIMYQQLAELHPHFSLFQLELANAHTRVNNYAVAKNIYTALRYHPIFGEMAQYALAKIKDSETQQPNLASAQKLAEKLRRNDIVVPLIAVGNSFLVDTSIERQGSRLLLDTGASITALSRELIQRLNLVPSGQSIQLNTANGPTVSRLYRVKRMSFGGLTLENIIVAEIDLDRRSGFNGLLGTDALNKFKSQYSYVIDNQKNALIFRAR